MTRCYRSILNDSMHFLRIFDLLSWDHPAQLRGMWTGGFGNKLPFRCDELHSISQCIVCIRIVRDHVNEIWDAAYIISSRYEIYALKLFDITWARLEVLNFFCCQIARMLHFLRVLNSHITAKESGDTTMINLMRTTISVTLITFRTISFLDFNLISPFKRQTCCCTVPVIKVSHDTLFKECLLIVRSDASFLPQFMQRLFDFVWVSQTTTLPLHSACLWDIVLSLSLPYETICHIFLWN